MTQYPMAALGELCNVSIGRTPRRNEPRYWGGPYPWATVRDLNGETLMSTQQGITDAAIKAIMPQPVKPNTLLFSFKLSIGKMAFAGCTMHHNEAIAALPVRNPNVLDREFLFHVLKTTTHDERANHAVLGKVLNKRKVEELKIPLPPLDEQRRIADILNRAARIERLRARLNKSLRDFVPALFIKMFGDPIGNPMRWEQRRLGDVSEIQGGLQVTRKRANHPLKKPYLRVANVLRDQLVLDEIKCIRLTENELGRVRLQRNDLLIVEGHGNPGEIGRAAIWDGSIKDCVHQNHLIRVRPNRNSIIPEFACAYLNSTSGRQHLLRSGKTTSGLNTISTSDVKACALIVPPLDLQNRFAGIVAAARDVAATTEASLYIVSALSASLMIQLLENGA